MYIPTHFSVSLYRVYRRKAYLGPQIGWKSARRVCSVLSGIFPISISFTANHNQISSLEATVSGGRFHGCFSKEMVCNAMKHLFITSRGAAASFDIDRPERWLMRPDRVSAPSTKIPGFRHSVCKRSKETDTDFSMCLYIEATRVPRLDPSILTCPHPLQRAIWIGIYLPI